VVVVRPQKQHRLEKMQQMAVRVVVRQELILRQVLATLARIHPSKVMQAAMIQARQIILAVVVAVELGQSVATLAHFQVERVE
jgi:hypothetical protein